MEAEWVGWTVAMRAEKMAGKMEGGMVETMGILPAVYSVEW